MGSPTQSNMDRHPLSLPGVLARTRRLRRDVTRFRATTLLDSQIVCCQPFGQREGDLPAPVQQNGVSPSGRWMIGLGSALHTPGQGARQLELGLLLTLLQVIKSWKHDGERLELLVRQLDLNRAIESNFFDNLCGRRADLALVFVTAGKRKF